MKKIAIIGQPNVGKSSLFNRLLKKRDAITSEEAGTTRDVKRRIALILDKQAELLDTGGLDKGCELFDKIKEKSLEAAHKADIIYLPYPSFSRSSLGMNRSDAELMQ